MYSPIHYFPVGSGHNRGDFRGDLGKVLYYIPWNPAVQNLFLIQLSFHLSKLTWRKHQIDVLKDLSSPFSNRERMNLYSKPSAGNSVLMSMRGDSCISVTVMMSFLFK